MNEIADFISFNTAEGLTKYINLHINEIKPISVVYRDYKYILFYLKNA